MAATATIIAKAANPVIKLTAWLPFLAMRYLSRDIKSGISFGHFL